MNKIILILLLSFALVACSKPQTLGIPTNVRIEDELLRWDEVIDASNYTIKINEATYNSLVNELNLQMLEAGEYSIRVKAMSIGYIDSLYSDEYIYTKDEDIIEIKNVCISDQLLSWDKFGDDVIYIVNINNGTFELTNNEFDLSDLEANKFYQIKVKVKNGIYSPVLYYHTFGDVADAYQVYFNKNTEDDLLVDLGNEIIIYHIYNLDIELETQYYEIIDSTISFKNNYLLSLDYGNNDFKVFSSIGVVFLQIVIYDDRKPYMISNNNIKFNLGEEVEVMFELYDGQIVGLSGNGITSEDYQIINNKVVISSTFISFKFEENRKNLILGYNLKSNNNDIIGFIFISKAD